MEVLFAGVRVRDLEQAIDWYTRLFGRAADIVPNDDEVMWRVTDSAWVYVLRDSARAGHSLVTICVSDLESAVAELADRDITLGSIAAVGEGARKATGLDPDGKERTYEGTELLARAFCHEIDHIDGLLFVDRLTPLKRDLLKRKLRKKAKADDWDE